MSEPLGLRILHVDDVEINLLVMDQMLSMLGHTPVGAASGAEAFVGLDLLKNVKALREAARSTPVVLVTGDVMSFTGAELREMGFAGALAKPITAEALRGVIAAAHAGTDQFVGSGFSRAAAAG